MSKRGKKYLSAKSKLQKQVESGTANEVALNGYIQTAVDASYARFDESVDIAVRLGVDPRHADQMVRGTVVLPNGIGKEVTVIVFAKGEKEQEALEAGADYVGNDELIAKIKDGWFQFDKAVATPDVMGSVGKIGRLLGPRGLMPNKKTGTVTFDVTRAVEELKAGKIDFRVEKAGIVHATMGKVSFGSEKLLENVTAFLETIVRLKPVSSKGVYIKGIAISTTMGPCVKIDANSVREFMK
ncbi:50S ribosomal protein L1 [Desulfococcaceae bacterium HSG7]|nr:50S ribosomal protein L1 [Desulfococcaceae bacterium HSG7]